MPSSRQRAASLWRSAEESIRSVARVISGRRRICSAKVKPSIPGIWASESTRANGSPAATARSISARAVRAVRRRRRLHAPAGKYLHQNFAVGGVVVHDQNQQALQTRRLDSRWLDLGAARHAEARGEVKSAALAHFSLSTQMRPPIMPTKRLDIVRPRPLPPKRRVMELSACSNGVNIAFSFSDGMPMPESRTAKCRQTSSSVRSMSSTCAHHLALFRELDRVADQVGEDLAQPAGVADDQGVRDGGTDVAGQLQSLMMRPQRQRFGHVAEPVGQRKRDGLQVELARLDLGEIEDVVDDAEQGIGRAF